MNPLVIAIALFVVATSSQAQAAVYICNTSHYGEYNVDVEMKTAYHTTYVKGRPDSTDLKVDEIVSANCPDCYDVRLAPNSLGTVLTLVIRAAQGELRSWAPGWTGSTLLERMSCTKK